MSRLPELVAGLEGLKEESAENRARETVLARQTKDAVSRLTELESRHSEYLKAESSISQHAQRVSELDARITTVTAEAERAEQLKAEISLLEDETKDLEALTEEGDRLRELQRLHQLRMKDHEAAYKRRQDFLADHDKKLKQMSEKLFATERRVTDLKTDITKERAFELLREDGALEERLSRIEREIVWLAGRPEILKELDLERRKAGILRERVGEDVAKGIEAAPAGPRGRPVRAVFTDEGEDAKGDRDRGDAEHDRHTAPADQRQERRPDDCDDDGADIAPSDVSADGKSAPVSGKLFGQQPVPDRVLG